MTRRDPEIDALQSLAAFIEKYGDGRQTMGAMRDALIELEHFHDWWNRLGFQSRLVCDSLLSMVRRGIVMGKAYSQDLRERVMAAVDAGTGAYAAASFFRVSVSYIYKALGRRERTGQTSARPWAGGPKPKLAAHDDA